MADSLGPAQKQADMTSQSPAKVVLRGIAAASLVGMAACSQVPSGKSHTSKIDPVWGVEAPKKKVADGDPVPPGGGRYQVGKPYMVGGRMYFPHEDTNYNRTGTASWYGDDAHGRETANGEVYDKDSLSAAHPTLPIPSYARVTNTDNGRSVLVRINDRGPYVGNRLIDVSERAADLLGFKGKGLGHVQVQYVAQAPVEGSDQRMLVASLRGPGAQATLAQDRALIAQRDRAPSDGRMTGVALANVIGGQNTPRPIVLASATEAETRSPTVTPSIPRQGYTPSSLPPPQIRSATPAPIAPRAQIAIAPTQAGMTPPGYARSAPATVAGTLGTLPARGTAATLAPLADPDAIEAKGPIQLAPGAIPLAPTARPMPVTPSRYGPTGQGVYPKVAQSQGFMPQARVTAAHDAIDRLIVANIGPAAPHIDLGAYARPENAARVAELMRPYGTLTTSAVRGGLGESMTVVRLDLAPGMVAGDVLSVAERFGIRSAAIVE